MFAYIAAVAAHPTYIERFRSDLATPGLRIPLIADAAVFFEAAKLGRRIVWLHTFGERFADASAGRARLPIGRRPQVPKGGAIPTTPEGMPRKPNCRLLARSFPKASSVPLHRPRPAWTCSVAWGMMRA